MYRIIFPICFFVLAATALHARQYPDSILFRDYTIQFEAREAIIRPLEGNDSAQTLAAIRSMEKWAADKGDLPMQYGVAVSRYAYLMRRHLIDRAALERGTRSLLNELENEEMDKLSAELLATLANYYWSEKIYVPAFEYSTKAYSIYSSLSQAEFPMKSAFTSEFGGIYYHFRDFNTAKKYFIEALEAVHFSNVSMLNTTGLCYTYLANYDSAGHFFRMAYTLAEKQTDTAWMGLLLGNLGYMHYNAGDYDKALPLLEKELKINLDEHKGDRFNAANSLALISSIYLSKNDKEKALSFALQAYTIAKNHSPELPFEIQKRIFPALARAYAANGNTALAYAFLDSAATAKDTLAKRTSQLILAGAQHSIDADKHLAAVQKYNHEQKIHLLIRNSLIAGIILFVIISILLINSQRVKFANTQKRLEAEKLQAEVELKHAAAQLSSFTQSISDKNELIEQFTAELSRMQKHTDPAAIRKNETLQKLQESVILTEHQWNDFHLMFDKAHRGFSKRLKQKAHGLSPIDMRFMLLCKLRLSTREMSGIMGVSTEAVRMNLDRLREKLNLKNTHVSIEDFAEAI